jgi:hypothetical protein
MAFTTLAVVKKHLLSSGFNRLKIEDQVVTLNGTDNVELPHHGLIEKSEVVKWISELIPTREGPLQLSGTDWYSLGHAHLVAESTILTLSDTLGTLYAEEADFQLDTALGCVRRVESGAIPDMQPLLVFYLYYSAFELDNDYSIDWVSGTLHRTTGSRIPDGAHVHVDYEVESGSITDELILQAIDDVQDRIVRALAPGYSGSSTDYGLQTGATLLVLAELARASAVEQLSRRLITDSAERAREWQKLVDSFEMQGWRILRPFLDPYQIHSPEKVAHA